MSHPLCMRKLNKILEKDKEVYHLLIQRIIIQRETDRHQKRIRIYSHSNQMCILAKQLRSPTILRITCIRSDSKVRIYLPSKNKYKVSVNNSKQVADLIILYGGADGAESLTRRVIKTIYIHYYYHISHTNKYSSKCCPNLYISLYC